MGTVDRALAIYGMAANRWEQKGARGSLSAESVYRRRARPASPDRSRADLLAEPRPRARQLVAGRYAAGHALTPLGVPLFSQRLASRYSGQCRANGLASRRQLLLGGRRFRQSLRFFGLSFGARHHREHLRWRRRGVLAGLRPHRSGAVRGLWPVGHDVQRAMTRFVRQVASTEPPGLYRQTAPRQVGSALEKPLGR